MTTDSKAANTFEVWVGNIGCVYCGPRYKEALVAYHEYRRQSKAGYGKAAGEPVTWLRNGEIEHEHIPAEAPENPTTT